MSLSFRILGAPGRDNALLVEIDSGKGVERLLFDCGGGCLSGFSYSEIQGIDQLFFSHVHMDHIAGFDSFFRCNFARDKKPNRIWGPPDTGGILQHRFQGYLWNLHDQMAATWLVSDIYPQEVRTVRMELREAFAIRHDEGVKILDRNLWEGIGCSVEVVTMDHQTPSLAYIVREKARKNIDLSRLSSLGLRPGPWMKDFKREGSQDSSICVCGKTYAMNELQRELIVETPGDSVGYLTDFALDPPAIERLAEALRGCRTIVCEAQYRQADVELARHHFHSTTAHSATLAKQAKVEKLILFHLSDRYDSETWIEMLDEARQIFPNSQYPEHWDLQARGNKAADRG